MDHTFISALSLITSILNMAFISLTMLLRGNDYRRKNAMTSIAIMRISGFVLSGFSPLGVVAWWIATGQWPSVFQAMFLTGISLVFFTTENLPPWWTFLTKGSCQPVENQDESV